jgi:hypothetical protein
LRPNKASGNFTRATLAGSRSEVIHGRRLAVDRTGSDGDTSLKVIASGDHLSTANRLRRHYPSRTPRCEPQRTTLYRAS